MIEKITISSYKEFLEFQEKYRIFKDNTLASDFSNFIKKNISAKNHPSANLIMNGKYEYIVSQIKEDDIENKNIKCIKFLRKDGDFLKEIKF